MNVRYSRRALAQISEILERLSTDSPNLPSRFANRLQSLAELLARHPTIGRRTNLANVRVFATRPYPYLLFYRIEPESRGIVVLRVRHMARKEDFRTGR